MKGRIFQGDGLSPLLFVLSMVPSSLILRKVNTSYEWGNKEYKLNHLLFMDDFEAVFQEWGTNGYTCENYT